MDPDVILIRCRYWPNCLHGSECKFIHPIKNCTHYPNCYYKDKCTFIHPICKYGLKCKDKKCIKFHQFQGRPETPQQNGETPTRKILTNNNNNFYDNSAIYSDEDVETITNERVVKRVR